MCHSPEDTSAGYEGVGRFVYMRRVVVTSICEGFRALRILFSILGSTKRFEKNQIFKGRKKSYYLLSYLLDPFYDILFGCLRT